jgi:hypothetical protein
MKLTMERGILCSLVSGLRHGSVTYRGQPPSVVTSSTCGANELVVDLCSFASNGCVI